MKSPHSSQGLVGRALSRMSRYTEILTVLARYGFADLVRRVDLDVYRRLRGSGAGRVDRKARRSWTRPQRVRMALEDLGPTFVKIGQLLSHRPDIVPLEITRELESLRSNVPAFSFEEVSQIIQEELNKPPQEVFLSFGEEPIASASIGQVHQARLMDGSVVAVKVQRPGIRQIIESDLAILKDLARLVERRVPSLAPFAPQEAVREFERVLHEELDFLNEADNIETFRKNFIKDVVLVVPQIFKELSTHRILVMDFIQGIPVGNLPGLTASGADLAVIARRGASCLFRQVFEHRFFHADPHGANLLVLPDNKIAFLDFGMMGVILPSQQRFLVDLLTGLVAGDSSRTVRAVLSWSGYLEPEDVRRLTTDVENVMEHFLNRPLGQLDIGKLIVTAFSIIRRYQINFPSNFYLLGKALMMVENIAAQLDPQFSFIKAAEPYVRKMLRREFDPRRIGQQTFGLMGDSLRLVQHLPGGAMDILNLLKAGKLRMEFEAKGLEPLNDNLRTIVTRLSASILLASMIMGSSILVQSEIPPLIYGIPAIGLVGFVAAGFFGIILLISLWRHHG